MKAAQTESEKRIARHCTDLWLDESYKAASNAKDFMRSLPGDKPTERIETAMREIELARDELNQ